MTGCVKFYMSVNGWGFIVPDEPGADIFVHASGLRGEVKRLEPGERVSFDVSTNGPRGLMAVNVRVVAAQKVEAGR